MNTNIQARYARTRLEKKKKNKREKKWYEESQTNHTSVPCSAKWAKHLQIKKETRKKKRNKQTFSNR